MLPAWAARGDMSLRLHRKARGTANTGFHMGRFPQIANLKYTTTENILETLQRIQEVYKLDNTIQDFGQDEMDQFGYAKQNSLGSGSFGAVFPVTWPAPGSYAVKVMTIQSRVQEQSLDRFSENLMVLQYGTVAARFFKPGQRWRFVRNTENDKQATFRTCDLIIAELSRLHRQTGYWNLHHIEHMQKYTDMLETNVVRVNIFTQRCLGDIESLVYFNKNIFEADEWNTLVADLGAAMHYIHSMGMAHLDIKPNNVLYKKSEDGKNIFMLTDYDMLSSTAKSGEYAFFRGGTPGFVPPSVEHNYWVEAENLKVWLYGVDLYAFSVTILSVLPELRLWMRHFLIVKEIPNYKYSSFLFEGLRNSFSRVELNFLQDKIPKAGTRNPEAMAAALKCIQAAHALGTSQDSNNLQTAKQTQNDAINAIFSSCGYTTLGYPEQPVSKKTPLRARATPKATWR